MLRLLVLDDTGTLALDLAAALSRAEFIVRRYPPKAHLAATATTPTPLPEAHLLAVDITRWPPEQIATLRNLAPPIPIIALLEQDDETTEVLAYQAGAHMVIALPLRPRSLALRLKALVGRQASLSTEAAHLAIGNLLLNREELSATYHNRRVVISKREFDILYRLANKPGKLFTRTELLDGILGPTRDHALSPRAIDVHICNLREKIHPQLIKTFKGKGYQLDVRA